MVAHPQATRLDGIPPTIFTTMSQLAVQTGAINLGQGFPDADGPSSVIETVVSSIRDGAATGANQYAPGLGIRPLREAIARHQQRHYGLTLDPDTQVVVTTGATEGIAAAMFGLINPGDEVIVLEPYYDSYAAAIQMAGGVRRPVTLRAPDFRLDVDELRAAVTAKTRMLLINSPHNPTGTVLFREELMAIADVAIAHDLIVLSDEVYEHLVFGDAEHIPLATLPGMAERTVTLSSAGKMFSFTGWKIGWASGAPDLVAAIHSAKQWLSFCSGSAFQPAVAHALDHESGFYAELTASMQSRRDELCAGLATLDMDVCIPQGTYFATTDVTRLGWADAMEFCMALPERAGVVAIPASAFYDNLDEGRHRVRWAFCKDSDVIGEGIARLQAADLRA